MRVTVIAAVVIVVLLCIATIQIEAQWRGMEGRSNEGPVQKYTCDEARGKSQMLARRINSICIEKGRNSVDCRNAVAEHDEINRFIEAACKSHSLSDSFDALQLKCEVVCANYEMAIQENRKALVVAWRKAKCEECLKTN